MKKLLLIIIIAAAYSNYSMAGGPTVNTTFSAQTIFAQPIVGSVTSGNFTISMNVTSGGNIASETISIVGFVGGSPSSIVGITSGNVTIPSGLSSLTSNISYSIDLTNYTQTGTITGYFLLTSQTNYNYFSQNQVPFSFAVTPSVTTSVNDLPTMAEAINIFPNPSTQGYVDIITDEPFKADIYTMTGTLVLSKTGSGTSRISITDKGQYIIRVNTASKQTTRKLIIE